MSVPVPEFGGEAAKLGDGTRGPVISSTQGYVVERRWRRGENQRNLRRILSSDESINSPSRRDAPAGC